MIFLGNKKISSFQKETEHVLRIFYENYVVVLTIYNNYTAQRNLTHDTYEEHLKLRNQYKKRKNISRWVFPINSQELNWYYKILKTSPIYVTQKDDSEVRHKTEAITTMMLLTFS